MRKNISKLFNILFGVFGRVNDTNENNYARTFFITGVAAATFLTLALAAAPGLGFAAIALVTAKICAVQLGNSLLVQPLVRTISHCITPKAGVAEGLVRAPGEVAGSGSGGGGYSEVTDGVTHAITAEDV